MGAPSGVIYSGATLPQAFSQLFGSGVIYFGSIRFAEIGPVGVVTSAATWL
jgi:hypothetical protein